MRAVDDLLLFRVVDAGRRGAATRLLDEGVGTGGWRHEGPVDLWELYDAGFAPDAAPVGVAATSEPDGGQQVSLVAVVVTPARRNQGIGTCMVQELADALRARGVLGLSAMVPSDNGAALAVLHRAGFRLSGVERGAGVTSVCCVMCFHLEL